MRHPPIRVTAALVITALAAVTLLVLSLMDGSDDGRSASSSSTATHLVETTASTATAAVTSTTLEIDPGWYPKGSSRYSDRRPPVTVTTLPVTSSTEEAEEGG